MLSITIYNVEHGFCAIVDHPFYGRHMFDCGHRSDPPWYPASANSGSPIDHLVITNLDEDHVSGLPALLQTTSITHLYSNPTITPEALKRLKHEHGMGPGIAALLGVLETKQLSWVPLVEPPFDTMVGYWNVYGTDFDDDTNNLSLAVFVRYGNFTMLFPGDLEAQGWKQLLTSEDFRTRLATVKIFVASHHGRRNGICEEVFEFCEPDVVLISDESVFYESQQTTPWYREQANGTLNYRSANAPDRLPDSPRFVFTTRNDGSINIAAGLNGGYQILHDLEYTT